MPKNKNQKTKTILRKDLLNVMAKCRKYFNSEDDTNDTLYIAWRDACRKAFGNELKSLRVMHLKDLARELRHYDNKTVVKVFQALGYEVVDNWADYVRNKRKTLKEKIYSKLCNGCSKENYCHEECEHCDAYYKALEKKGIKED